MKSFYKNISKCIPNINIDTDKMIGVCNLFYKRKVQMVHVLGDLVFSAGYPYVSC